MSIRKITGWILILLPFVGLIIAGFIYDWKAALMTIALFVGIAALSSIVAAGCYLVGE